MHIHTKNLLVISSPLSQVFQMFSYFVLAKNALNDLIKRMLSMCLKVHKHETILIFSFDLN
jgi:hypothetical protein